MPASRRRACAPGSRPDAAASAAHRTTISPSEAITSSPSSTKCVARQTGNHRHHFGKIPTQRLAGFGEQRHRIATPHGDAAKPIPFGLELPAVALRQLLDAPGFHRLDRLQRHCLAHELVSAHSTPSRPQSVPAIEKSPGVRPRLEVMHGRRRLDSIRPPSPALHCRRRPCPGETVASASASPMQRCGWLPAQPR